MSKICLMCGKKPVAGRTIVRRGLAKKKGGAGRKITGTSRRWFKPNIRHVKAVMPEGVRFIYICAKCLKAGKIKKAVNAPTAKVLNP